MGELISQVGVLPTTAGGILALFCILILTGQVPTRREMRDLRADRDKAIEREDKAMELANTWQKVASEHGMTLNKILDAVETTNHVMVAIQTGLSRATDSEPGS